MTLGSHQQTIGKSQSHFTPSWVLDRLGSFDLDPCAGSPRPWDIAKINLTEKDNGLAQPWHGRVFLNPPFNQYQVGAWVERMAEHNLADLNRMRGLDQEGVDLLRKAVAIDPNNADIHHSLGLALVRQHNYADAIPELRQASELAPDNARYAYVYAIALNSIGAGASAMELLENTHKRHPDRDTLLALVSIARETSDFATALTHARELVALYPTDMQLRMLVLDLEKRQAH